LPFLTLRDIPIVLNENNDRKFTTPMFGASIARADLVRALFLHGTYERYYFLVQTPAHMAEAEYRLSLYPNTERAELVLLEDYARLKHIDQMALLVGQASLHELAHLRRSQGRMTWPVCGITMSLSYTGAILRVLEVLLEGLYSHDSLICISHAGRKVVENMIRQVSNFMSEKFQVQISYPGQLPVIPLGVDAELFTPREQPRARSRFGIAPDATVFLYVGRFSTRFKMDLFPLVLAFAQWSQGKPDARLILAGDDSESNLAARLEEFAGAHGVADRVIVMPNVRVEDKPWLYAAADVFVSLSDNVQETQGLSVIEAMSAGLPVIVSDWDGYRDSVEHGANGFLVPTYFADCVEQVSSLSLLRGDYETHWLLAQSVSVDLKALVGYMDLLSENRALRRQMGARGREQVLSEYDWPVVIGKYEELWGELLVRAAAKANGEEPPFSHGLLSYDYLDIFRHYPTGIVTLASTVRVTELGRRFLQGDLRIAPLEQGHPRAPSLSRELAVAYDVKGAATVGALIEEVKPRLEGVAPADTFLHISRLIKYGVFELEAL
jgi:glycosyltransferase involved in cell wall biosynthesis